MFVVSCYLVSRFIILFTSMSIQCMVPLSADVGLRSLFILLQVLMVSTRQFETRTRHCSVP
jgi:hypothetical protein